MGSLIKIILGYSSPFWRNTGFSGELVCCGGDPLTQPVNLAYDACTVGYEVGENWTKEEGGEKNEHYAIVAFISGAFAVFWSEVSPLFPSLSRFSSERLPQQRVSKTYIAPSLPSPSLSSPSLPSHLFLLHLPSPPSFHFSHISHASAH
jgi:hypothetical protein